MKPIVSILMGGILPFGAIFIEVCGTNASVSSQQFSDSVSMFSALLYSEFDLEASILLHVGFSVYCFYYTYCHLRRDHSGNVLLPALFRGTFDILSGCDRLFKSTLHLRL